MDTDDPFATGVDMNKIIAEYTAGKRRQYEEEAGIQLDRESSSAGDAPLPFRSDSVASAGPTSAMYGRGQSSPASARHGSVVFELIPPPPESFLVDNDKIKNSAPPADREFAWPEPISETEVRDALSREAKKHSMWKTAAVKKLTISDITCLTALHYTLETFAETRSTTISTEAFSAGQYAEHLSAFEAFSTVTMDPWDLPCEPNADFVDENRMFEMPHTTQIAVCKTCNAEGCYHCFHCNGSGSDKCQYCSGTGMKTGIAHPAVYTHPMVATYPNSGQSRGFYQAGGSLAGGVGRGIQQPVLNRTRGYGAGGMNSLSYGMGTPVHFMSVSGIPPPGIGHHDLCYFCHGRGVRECNHCKGQGKKPCGACSGSGSTRTFTKLRIRYSVERSEFYHDNGLPEKLLRNVSGEIVLAESGAYVLPLRNYPVDEVNDQSKRHCQIHLQKCMGRSRILQQRHTLEAVPVAQVTYNLNGKEGVFWVYGHERLCYVPKYPSKCSIL